MNQNSQNIKKLISRGDTKKAIASLKDSNLYQVREDSIVMISARFEELNNHKILNIISNSEYNLEAAKINMAILDLLSGKELQTEKKSKKKMIWIVIGGVIMVAFLTLLISVFGEKSKQNQHLQILDERANTVNRELAIIKEEISSDSQLTDVKKQHLLKSFNYMESDFKELHQKNKDAINSENYLLSQELTKEIHFLSNRSSLEKLREVSPEIPAVFAGSYIRTGETESPYGIPNILLYNDSLRSITGINKLERLSGQNQEQEMVKRFGMWERFADFHDMLSKEIDNYPIEETNPE